MGDSYLCMDGTGQSTTSLQFVWDNDINLHTFLQNQNYFINFILNHLTIARQCKSIIRNNVLKKVALSLYCQQRPLLSHVCTNMGGEVGGGGQI